MSTQNDTFSLEKIKEFGIKALQDELFEIQSLPSYINDDFAKAITEIINSNGRVVITGIGKSAIIGQKIVATMNSTGQPALFMHAADAIHGDLGMIQPQDVVIVISKSGNTSEIVTLLPLLKNLNCPIIAIVGNIQSKLAQGAHYVLNTTVNKEACPNNLAPTSSTTAQLMMGDALAVSLIRLRNFSDSDFSKYHPGGALGKQLYLTCGDIAEQHAMPKVTPSTTWKEVIVSITESRLGATAVVDQNNILGIITDGDVRRMLAKFNELQSVTALDMMSNNPSTIDKTELASEAARIMQSKKITQLIVTDSGSYCGMVHLHDLYLEGIIA